MSILVIDVGSSSVRALLLDEKLEVIPEAAVRIAYQFEHEPKGASQINAAWLRQQAEACIDAILKHPQAGSIHAVGMATFVGNLLGVDAQNQPITPVYTYADTRSAADVDALRHEVDTLAAYQRTGCPHHAAYHPGTLHWLQRTEPVLFQSVQTWLDFATYCYRAWFHHAVPCSYSVASWSGLLNHATLAWDATWLDTLNISADCFPALADYDAVQHGLNALYTQRWPQLANVPFYLAVGDGAAANVGSGGVRADRVVLTVGTTAALRIVTDKPVDRQQMTGLWHYRVDQNRYLIGGATSEGGNIFHWARDVLRLDVNTLDDQLKSCQPDSHGLTVLPLLAGERSPGYEPYAVGTIHGMQLSTDAEDMLLALLESVALRLSIIADMLNPGTPAQIYGAGGALAASEAWAQILANAFNRTLYLLDEPEVTARGVAALIMGDAVDVTKPRITRTLTPDAQAAEILRAARERQQALYNQFYG